MRAFDCDVLANNKDWLVEQYVINNLSMREIAFICDVSADSIRTRLNRFGIQIRDRKAANKLAYNKGVPKTITPELKEAQENKKQVIKQNVLFVAKQYIEQNQDQKIPNFVLLLAEMFTYEKTQIEISSGEIIQSIKNGANLYTRAIHGNVKFAAVRKT